MSNQKFSTGRETAPKTQRGPVLALTENARKPPGDQRGSDPYNTSGSFDRKKNWARVGRR